MSSETLGLNAGLQPTFGFQSLHRHSRDDGDNVKNLSGKVFVASLTSCIHSATQISSDVTSSFSYLDVLSVHADLERQSGQSSALGALALGNMVCLREPSTIKEHNIKEQLRDAITKQPCSEVTISSQQDNNASQVSRQFLSLSEQLGVEDALVPTTYKTEFPLIGTFLDILQSCRRVSSLVHAKQAHLHLCHNGLEAHKDVGNYLVPILVECGAMDYAKQVFHRLSYRNEHSWTSLIQGHIIAGQYDEALSLYKLMLHDLIEPSNFTFVVLLKASAQENDVERGKFFHAVIAKRGTEQDSFVGSVLVDMYTKCGLFSEARHLVNEMSVQDVFPWTSIISGYVEFGLPEEALVCMEEIGRTGLSPDAHTIACCLTACADLGAVEEGFKLHTMLIGMGFTNDVFAGNALMEMYAKCGALLEVRKVFEGFSVRDTVSWIMMIAAYVEHDCSKEALACLEPMQNEGVSPVAATFVCILKACTSISGIDDLRFLHSEVLKKGFEGDVSVGNTLIDMYAKCQSLEEAWEVLSKLPTQSAVSWTALMTGYLEQGDAEKILDSFEQILLEGVHMDEALSVCILKACSNLRALDKGFETHINISKLGFDNNTFVGNTLVGMYARCGALYETIDVFKKQMIQNVVSWNALLAAFSDLGQFKEAWTCYGQMKSEGVLFDTVTYTCILKACGSLGTIDKGHELHIELTKKGYDADLMIANTMIDMYGKCRSLAESQKVFAMLKIPVLVSWNALLQAYTVLKLDEEALSCFQQIQVNGYTPDVISWNMMILCYAELGEKEKACLFFARMLEQGVLANDVVFVSILKACDDSACIETVRRIHAQVCNFDGYESSDVSVTTSLIDIYSKCGSMHTAQDISEALPKNVTAAWNALITGYARQGNSELIFSSLCEMAKNSIEPDEVTFLGILSVCSHAGLLDQGQKYFEIMCDSYDIVPDVEHLTCMVDLFGRAGHVDLVMTLVENLPVELDSVVWRTVMDACLKRGDTSFGSKTFNQALTLDRRQGGLYVYTANIYADVGLWEEAEID